MSKNEPVKIGIELVTIPGGAGPLCLDEGDDSTESDESKDWVDQVDGVPAGVQAPVDQVDHTQKDQEGPEKGLANSQRGEGSRRPEQWEIKTISVALIRLVEIFKYYVLL